MGSLTCNICGALGFASVTALKIHTTAKHFPPARKKQRKRLQLSDAAKEMLQRVDAEAQCIVPGTTVLRSDGTSVSVEDVAVGDALLNPDGKPCEVIGLLGDLVTEVPETSEACVEMKPPVPSKLNIGDVFRITASIWRMPEGSQSWEPFEASDLELKVLSMMDVDSDDSMLLCYPPGRSDEFAVLESFVLQQMSDNTGAVSWVSPESRETALLSLARIAKDFIEADEARIRAERQFDILRQKVQKTLMDAVLRYGMGGRLTAGSYRISTTSGEEFEDTLSTVRVERI